MDYRALLWRSNLHCYFTRPYVTSWSFFEAASCGARLLASKGEATKDIAEGNSIKMIDIEDQESVNQSIAEGLNMSIKGLYPRAKVLKGYGLSDSLTKWERLINENIKKKSTMTQ